jgi:hypothetical protein
MYKSWKFKVACAYLALGAMLGISVVGCAEHPKPLLVQPTASEAVNRLPEAATLTKAAVMQISVLCEQKQPSDPFRVQIGYWIKAGNRPQTVYTNAPCNSWNQLLAVLPSETGWRVLAADVSDANTAPDVVKAVARDLGHTK